ncbi:MAG: DUF5684 domain-containing protein [Acidimicrobiales bacterium]
MSLLAGLGASILGAAASAQSDVVLFVVILALVVLEIAAMWRIFEKAGRPGWAAIVPVYNMYVLLKVVGRPGWWLLLLLVPILNWIVLIVVLYDLSCSFGKGVGFTAGLVLLGFIFYLILGFGSAQYLGPAARNRYVLPAGGYQGFPPATEGQGDTGSAAQVAPSGVQPIAAPGWYVDPSARHELRYWDGTLWTKWVADAGNTSTDPI